MIMVKMTMVQSMMMHDINDDGCHHDHSNDNDNDDNNSTHQSILQ